MVNGKRRVNPEQIAKIGALLVPNRVFHAFCTLMKGLRRVKRAIFARTNILTAGLAGKRPANGMFCDYGLAAFPAHVHMITHLTKNAQ